jgi:hypothetical protein
MAEKMKRQINIWLYSNIFIHTFTKWKEAILINTPHRLTMTGFDNSPAIANEHSEVKASLWKNRTIMSDFLLIHYLHSDTI